MKTTEIGCCGTSNHSSPRTALKVWLYRSRRPLDVPVVDGNQNPQLLCGEMGLLVWSISLCFLGSSRSFYMSACIEWLFGGS